MFGTCKAPIPDRSETFQIVMLNLLQHPPIIRIVRACGPVDPETSSG
jgi:hypothetical protein